MNGLDNVLTITGRVDDAGRDAIIIEGRPDPDSWMKWGPTFLEASEPPIQYLISELLPAGVIALIHGEPRTLKTWGALDIALAAATGTPAFGLERFSVPQPMGVLYSSQEDSARLVRQRVKALLKGRGMDCPERLMFAVHAGINLESSEWQDTLIADIQRHDIRLVILDPIRRYSINVDKGPAEVRAITAYLRRLCIETGATILLVHHDVKPPASTTDNRRRGHRASGGDWFAAAECPISFEIAGDSQTVAYPESYKLSSDPEPFTFRLETDDPRNPTTARLIGKSTTSTDATSLAIEEAILTYLKSTPGANSNKIVEAVKKQKDQVLASLERLRAADKVDFFEGPRKAKLWTIR
jgi:hypothetical protein